MGWSGGVIVRIPLLNRLSFAQQFLFLSLLILVGGMLVIGLVVQSAIEQGVTRRTAAVTALYVDSFVSPLAQPTASTGTVTEAQRRELDDLLGRTPLGTQVVAFKIWAPNGEILYSPNPELIGRTFEVDDQLESAFAGDVVTEISDLSEAENEFERESWDRLIETYAPIRVEGTGAVFAVSEFYQLPDPLIAEIRDAQIRGWIIVGAATLVMYLLLVGMTLRASNTIRRQRDDLIANVKALEATLAENRNLQSRVNRAAARTTALNEQFLGRLSADLHDGPAQNVALALLRVDDLADPAGNGGTSDVDVMKRALDSALTGIRSITLGLRSPDVEGLSPCRAAQRAVTDFERLTGDRVNVECEEHDDAVGPLPTNITIYRVVQESLANSFKHAGPANREVTISRRDGSVELKIADDGTGFDLSEVSKDTSLGLALMRERVEVLGGRFSVRSDPDRGTTVEATIPVDHADG
jgi:signal transduction histidine kinase